MLSDNVSSGIFSLLHPREVVHTDGKEISRRFPLMPQGETPSWMSLALCVQREDPAISGTVRVCAVKY